MRNSGSRNSRSSSVDVTNEEILPQHEMTTTLLISVTSSLLGCSVVFGFNAGVVNAPQKVIEKFINESFYKHYDSILSQHGTSSIWAVCVGIFGLGGLFGGLTNGIYASCLGRKGAILFNNIFTIIGCIFMFLSGYEKIRRFEFLILGRFIVGYSSGIGSGLAPLYIAEISPVRLRGSTGALTQLAIISAITLSYILGNKHLLGKDELWHYLLGISIIPALFQLTVMPFCPESPDYLVKCRSNVVEGRRALMILRGRDDVEEEIQRMVMQANGLRNRPKTTLCTILRGYQRTPMVISIMMQLSQILSGVNAILYYSTDIIDKAVGDHTLAQYATIVVGIVQIVVTIISVKLMMHIGRRQLHLYGIGGMFIFFCTLSIGLCWKESHLKSLSWSGWLSVVSVFFYSVFFSIGPGSIPWLIVPELFPLESRGIAGSVSFFCNWLGRFIVGQMFPLMQIGLKEYTFIPFILLLAIFWVFLFYWLPETKDLSFETIQNRFIMEYQRSQQENNLIEDPVINVRHAIDDNVTVVNERTPLLDSINEVSETNSLDESTQNIA